MLSCSTEAIYQKLRLRLPFSNPVHNSHTKKKNVRSWRAWLGSGVSLCHNHWRFLTRRSVIWCSQATHESSNWHARPWQTLISDTSLLRDVKKWIIVWAQRQFSPIEVLEVVEWEGLLSSLSGQIGWLTSQGFSQWPMRRPWIMIWGEKMTEQINESNYCCFFFFHHEQSMWHETE